MGPTMDEQVRVDETRRWSVDGEQLRRELGIDESEIRWRKSYTNFTEADVEALLELRDAIGRASPAIADDVEAHIRDHEEALVFLERSTLSFEQLKEIFVWYLNDIANGSYDEEYFNRRTRMGKIHDLLGLTPKYYLGAYSVFFGGLADVVGEQMKAEADDESLDVEEVIDRTLDYVMTLFKIINIDQQVEMDTYIHSHLVAQRLQRQRIMVLNRVLRHNLRNDLNVVSCHANIARGQIDDDDGRGVESVERIQQKVDELIELSNTAREVEQAVEQSVVTTEFVPLDEMLQSILDEVDDRHPDAVVSIDGVDEGMHVPDSLRPAFRELADNGIEHNDQPQPTVTITAETQAEETVAVIRFADDGPGIPDHERTILEKQTETPLQHSRGLGLWLVQWSVENAGGTLDVSENSPRGSVVTVSLSNPIIDR